MTGFVCIENPPLDKALTENQNKSEILIDSTCFLHKIEKLSFSLPSPKFVVSLNTININFSSIVL